MSTLKEIIASDIADVFMNTDEYAEAVYYLQGEGPEIETTGVREAVEHDATDDEGFSIKVVAVAWLMPVADFGETVPRPGDVIRVTVGTVEEEFEVVPKSSADDRFEKLVCNTMYRVHTKQVK